MAAIMGDQVDIVKMLISNDYYIIGGNKKDQQLFDDQVKSGTDNYENTPLHYSFFKNNTEISSLLI